jgi:two-component system nitrogen regulation sensor histidine kinase NtrY
VIEAAPTVAPARRDPGWLILLAVALAAAEAALHPRLPFLVAAAAVALVAGARRSHRVVLALAALTVVLVAAARLHAGLLERRWEPQARRDLEARARAVERRKETLVASIVRSADRVAALPDTRAALEGDRAALIRVFQSLEAMRSRDDAPAIAVHALPLSMIAWSGRIPDLSAFRGLLGSRRGVFILEGSVSATLLATAPIPATGGEARGLATALLTVAVQRNIRNEYLSDFDLLVGADPAAEIHYVDARSQLAGPEPFGPAPAGVLTQELALRGPAGELLATVRLLSPAPDQARREVEGRYRTAAGAAAALAFLAWAMVGGGTLPSPRWRWAGAATAVRAVLLALGPPEIGGTAAFFDPETYASTLLGPLLRSPADLFLTAAWLATLAAMLLWAVLRRPPARAPLRWLLALPVAAAVLVAAFAWIADTVANCTIDVETAALLPRSPQHLLLHLALLLVLAAAFLALTAVFMAAGAPPRRTRDRLLLAAGWALLTVLAWRFWPQRFSRLPLPPAVVLLAMTAALALTRERWGPRLRAAVPGARAGLALAGVLVLALVLFPTVFHFVDASTRQQIETEYAPLVQRQPQWREYVLTAARDQIDSFRVIEDEPRTLHRPRLEELAFAVWSQTDLAAFGLSSALEIQDASGAVITRFALNLPSLSGPTELPASEAWQVSRELKTVASAQRPVLHARRLLVYHGEVHGGIHVYVGEDFWNLPFLTGRDPYSVLYRSAPRGSTRERPLALLAYERGLSMIFSSAEAPPALDETLAARVRSRPTGVWAVLPVDGRENRVFLFADAGTIYALAYTRREPHRYVADVVEAASSFTLMATVALLLVVLARTAAGRRSLTLPSIVRSVEGRFALRLFVASLLLALVPMVVLQVIVRGFVADRLQTEFETQALERAVFAKKVVEDYAFFQRNEPAPMPAVTDEALVWLADRIRNDLDVFARGTGAIEAGRLLASSKRELYDSGLLPPRVPGEVFRKLTLEGAPNVVRDERIGGFSYHVVSVPLRLEGVPGILSIPLALRQREVEAVLDDLDRTILLASVVFLALAAILAHRLARRISGPIRELTHATARVAQGDLAARVEAKSRDELRALVESFNRMASDLDRQRRDLERSNRLAAWADMARQVAHEVKNPLTPIQLSAEHLRRVFADRSADFAETLETCTQTILKQVRTLRGIVTEFSAFARPPAPVLELQELPAVLTELVKPYQEALPPGVDLALEIERAVPPVRGDRRLIERAALNLIENALQAVGEKGTIRVRLRRGDEGRRVEVIVEDSGRGMEPEVRDRVFQPFFSTKTSGSGLGLALVKKIAEDHGGGVTLESAAGQGTRATLWLPAAAEAPAPDTAVAAGTTAER